MTHFTVLVCCKDRHDLDGALAPFDENDEDNENARWDWWVIGGRWAGSLLIKPGHESEVIMPGEATWSTPEIRDGYCDGGPKRAIDVDRMRDDAARNARVRFGEYAKLTEGTPDPLPWKTFADNISEGNGYTVQQARDEYHAQPRIAVIKGTAFDHLFGDTAEEFACTEAVYAERCRAAAVPGYALLTTDGRWMAPGEMGWWGMSTDEQPDRIGYGEVANAYIDSLSDDVWLIMTDCHI